LKPPADRVNISCNQELKKDVDLDSTPPRDTTSYLENKKREGFSVGD
jgi:hypothetical protein